MKKKVRVEEPDTADEVPAYIVTFSDMVTLLLTFFVMLLSMADMQDPDLFYRGRDSVIESLQNFGLGVMLSRSVTPRLNAQKEHYQTTEDEDTDRNIDARREKRRRAFERLNESMTTLSSQIVGDRVDFSVLDAGFERGEARLSQAGREVIWQFARTLQPPASGRKQILYVLGLAAPAAQAQRQWTLSAQRAQVVADFLRQALAEDRCDIYSWGAGSGYNWGGRNGTTAHNARLMIGVVRDTR